MSNDVPNIPAPPFLPAKDSPNVPPPPMKPGDIPAPPMPGQHPGPWNW